VLSHISRKTSEIPGFPVKFINANELHRKSGGMGHPSFVREPEADSRETEFGGSSNRLQQASEKT
jgi:hypothetical protein